MVFIKPVGSGLSGLGYRQVIFPRKTVEGFRGIRPSFIEQAVPQPAQFFEGVLTIGDDVDRCSRRLKKNRDSLVGLPLEESLAGVGFDELRNHSLA